MELILGIDTSNYTTSMCAVSWQSGEVVSEARRLLPVAQGERGLRQSDALFFHVAQLSLVMSKLMERISSGGAVWRGIGVSVRPRPLASSYMPVFLAGSRFAETIAGLYGLPVVRTSHQEGHLAAADYDLGLSRTEPFLAVHLSGGTSDVLYARPSRFGYDIETLGSSTDLNAGQFVDRVGVALGLPFPAGPGLERLLQTDKHSSSQGTESSLSAEEDDQVQPGATKAPPFRLSASVKGASMSFSGPCSAALRVVEQKNVPTAEVAEAVFTCIANSLVKAVSYAASQRPEAGTCVLAGGVMANGFIRDRVTHRLRILHPTLSVQFARPEFSSDNALGVATIARRFLREN